MGGVGQTLAWVARVKINLHGSKNWRTLKSKGGAKIKKVTCSKPMIDTSEQRVKSVQS